MPKLEQIVSFSPPPSDDDDDDDSDAIEIAIAPLSLSLSLSISLSFFLPSFALQQRSGRGLSEWKCKFPNFIRRSRSRRTQHLLIVVSLDRPSHDSAMLLCLVCRVYLIPIYPQAFCLHLFGRSVTRYLAIILSMRPQESGVGTYFPSGPCQTIFF